MVEFKQGNLLESDVEAVVNTVNTVGVMGKGIALMFKERFPDNFKAYAKACKLGEVRVGHMFVTETGELTNPRFIINFPTKQDWRHPTKIQWVKDGLRDLEKIIRNQKIHSIALPPLGCGNGGLDWDDVKPLIEDMLSHLPDVKAVVFEPTAQYQNVVKRKGVHKLTPARAIISELVRRYWVLGIECSILEIQKLAWFAERVIEKLKMENVLDLRFVAHTYGPYAERLQHLLNGLDGSYLRCEKRLRDASPFDTIWFDEGQKSVVKYFLEAKGKNLYLEILNKTEDIIDGFQSPLGLELLATVDWLLCNERCAPSVSGVRAGLAKWPGNGDAGARKQRIFSDRMLDLAIGRLIQSPLYRGSLDAGAVDYGFRS